jgi:bifunctional non-homologous end joining protein LigD
MPRSVRQPSKSAPGARGTKGRELKEYRSKRSFRHTPEPAGDRRPKGRGDGARFVVQEHDASHLHWDLRLERDGVLVSWALPKGVPDDPKENRLAVHTEDHPLEYIDFEGEIPEGEYGAGTMRVWDSGTYEAEKFESAKVIVTLHGERVSGKYALFQTKGKNWMIHRMDPPVDPDTEPMPSGLRPMLARLAELPENEGDYGYEVKWDGIRALLYSDHGHVRLESRTGRDITPQFPEVRKLGRELGSRRVVLDGEIVAFDAEGRPSFQRLQGRIHLASESAVRNRMRDVPATYMVFDVLYLDGRSLLALGYEERRELLAGLELDGASWQTPDHHLGEGGALLEASRRQGLEGIVAKRLGSRYEPGKRSGAWLKVKNVRTQDVVIGGWLPGKGRREGQVGALLVGYVEETDGEQRLKYAGRVGTGFDAAKMKMLAGLLEADQSEESPFDGRQPPKESIFVEPRHVAEVAFSEWTSAGTLRAPVFRGLRDDKRPEEAVREEVV